MIDPILSLTFNLQAHEGTYALLLGSGVSRSAGIPTGWEVTLNLIEKLAHLQNEDCYPDPDKWYVKKYDRDPDYSEILTSIASTSAAQQQLLSSYFEPTEAERENGDKLPTKAHHAIAQLVKDGVIRVIITTNFDRLLESALEGVGIAPTIIASENATEGAPPLVHSKCTIIKVHGDYLDLRIKNSVEALSSYDEKMDRLLDQILDEYGLIVCGWSAEYDHALRSVFERARSLRYPLYWAALSDPMGKAKELITKQGGTRITIDGADSFFCEILEKVQALREFSRPHPLTLQRYLLNIAGK